MSDPMTAHAGCKVFEQRSTKLNSSKVFHRETYDEDSCHYILDVDPDRGSNGNVDSHGTASRNRRPMGLACVDLEATRYANPGQITRDNFSDLENAWQWKSIGADVKLTNRRDGFGQARSAANRLENVLPMQLIKQVVCRYAR